ncbi:DUF3489 domain-containing protein [Mesorhizobium sp. 10J20-29]
MSELKLTKLQRSTLHAAAVRSNYIAWPIRNGKLNAGSEVRVIRRLMAMGLVIEKPAIPKAPVWREDDQGQSLMVVISEAGLEAVGLLRHGKAGRRSRSAGKKGTVAAKEAPPSLKEPRSPRAGSKLAMLVELLGRAEGATIEELVGATGWQGHSIRGVMSGALVKKFGLMIASEKVEGRGRVYKAAVGSNRINS